MYNADFSLIWAKAQDYFFEILIRIIGLLQIETNLVYERRQLDLI